MRPRAILNVIATVVWIFVQTAMAFANHDVPHGAASSHVTATAASGGVHAPNGHHLGTDAASHHDTMSRITPSDHQHDDADADSCAVACFAVVMFDLTGELLRLRVREQYFAVDRLVMGLHPELPTPPPNASL